MNLVSLPFAGFVAGVLVIYYLVPRRAQNVVLLIASLGFCASWAWQFVVVLVMLTLFNFVAARYVRSDGQGAPGLLAAALAVNVAALFLLKYGGLFGGREGTGEALAPIGISFYTLGAMSFLVDVYRGQIPGRLPLPEFGLYMAYFPKLLAGPIERARAFLPQLGSARTFQAEAFGTGLALILLGAVRKVVIADTIASRIPRHAFDRPQTLAGAELAIVMLAYLFIVYNDFAGYTDIARGVSRLFGIELTPNFRTPFFARSFTELWSRWHITLTSWLRDYLYLPLSRALLRRQPDPRRLLHVIVPPMITLLASGLWHWASPHVLLWGALLGLWLALERLPARWRGVAPRQRAPVWRQVLSACTVIVLFGLAGVVFRLDVPLAVEFWTGLVSPGWWRLSEPPVYALMGILIVLSLAIDFCQHTSHHELPFLRWPLLARSALVAAAILAVFLATRSAPVELFVYQGF